jgi:CheY-like chemotaxis protein
MPKKVLIVDDDEWILDATALILEDAGYTIATVSKGNETYQKITSFQPDVILLDVLMSGKDGREICKKLKSDAITCHIPIIMISAHPTAGESALANGANDFLAKPFSSEEIIQAINKQTKAK